MRCPVCRAESDEGPNCRRCRADLSSLFTLEAQRQRALNATYQCLADGQFRRARALAEGAQALQNDAEARRLAAMSALLTRDFASASRIYNSLDK
jgi:hypothetical protein